MTTRHSVSLRVLPADYSISFRVEPTFVLRSVSSSSASSASEDSEEEGFHIPFTTSPLDECRGATKSAEPVRDVVATTTHKSQAQQQRRKNKKAFTMRSGR